MKAKRKWKVATILMTAVLLLMSGCGSNNAGNGASSNSSTEPSKESSAATTELNVAFFTQGNNFNDLPEIQDRINAITKEKIGVTVKFVTIPVGEWVQKTNLMLTSNEKLDLMIVSPFFGYNAQVAKGQLQPLDELLDKYGTDIKAAMDPEYLKAPKVNGALYGIPSLRDMASGIGMVMRKDLVEKYNIDISKIKSIDDLEPVLATIQSNEPDMAPLVPTVAGGGIFHTYWWVDVLGDSFGVLPADSSDSKIVNLFETPEYAQIVEKMHKWYNAGYILKDAATSKESTYSYIKSERGFGYFTPTKPGIEEQESASNGMPMVIANFAEPMSNTNSVTSMMWGIPRNSKTPDKAMQLLNLLYSDKEIVNLIDWGIEGKHYVKKSDTVIDYPEGVTAETNGYNLNMGFLFGNEFLSYVFEGSDPELWTKMDAFNKSAIKSKGLGFNFDSTPVRTEVAAVTNVLNGYKLGLETGTLDPAKALPEFNQKLTEAGIEKIIAEKQKQFDAWSAAN